MTRPNMTTPTSVVQGQGRKHESAGFEADSPATAAKIN
jgi:hypothetical protein